MKNLSLMRLLILPFLVTLTSACKSQFRVDPCIGYESSLPPEVGGKYKWVFVESSLAEPGAPEAIEQEVAFGVQQNGLFVSDKKTLIRAIKSQFGLSNADAQVCAVNNRYFLSGEAPNGMFTLVEITHDQNGISFAQTFVGFEKAKISGLTSWVIPSVSISGTDLDSNAFISSTYHIVDNRNMKLGTLEPVLTSVSMGGVRLQKVANLNVSRWEKL